MTINFCEITDKEVMLKTYPLINATYEHLNYKTFESAIIEMIQYNNYKMLIAYDGEIMAGITGFWISRMLYCGRYLQLNNLIVDKKYRNKGIGRAIINHMENLAIKFDCNKIVLDSYVENKKSHSLYFDLNYYIRGFHFMKDLK
jgi:GNAT superfamily N-acetyltransferase